MSDQYNVCKAVASGNLSQVLQFLGSGNAELLAEGFPDTEGTVCDDLVADLALCKVRSQEFCDLIDSLFIVQESGDDNGTDLLQFAGFCQLS